MNIAKLKGKVVENNMTNGEFASAIGIDASTLVRRFNNQDSFKIGEINRAVKVLHLTREEASDIFLPQ